MLVTAPISRPPALPPVMIKAVFRRVFLVDQVLGCGNEVGEGVLLDHHLARVVPLLAHLSAAADVRDAEDHTAIQEAQPVRREVDVVRDAVRAVTLKHIGRCPSRFRSFL